MNNRLVVCFVGICLIPSTLTTADAAAPSFDDLIQRHFDRWDVNRDGRLEAGEVNPKLIDPAIRGAEAAALASVHLYQRRVKDADGKRTWPPLSQDFLLRKTAEREETRRDTETAVPNFRIWFNDFAGRVARRQTELFSADAPNLVGFKQGRLGDCFFLATIGSAVHRTPERIRRMIHQEAGGSYRVTFGDGETVHIEHLTDGHLVLGSSVGEQGLWLNVLELAFARRWLASHELSRPDELSLDVLSRGGLSRQVVPILTGHEAKLTLLRDKPSEPPTHEHATKKEAEVAELLQIAHRLGHLTMTGTLTAKPLPAGIPGNHVLAVLDYDPVKRTVEVWNPWCNNRTPDGEPGLKNGYVTKGGRFTMPLGDFVRTFNGLTCETAEKAKPAE